jgi:hypothetical protein
VFLIQKEDANRNDDVHVAGITYLTFDVERFGIVAVTFVGFATDGADFLLFVHIK